MPTATRDRRALLKLSSLVGVVALSALLLLLSGGYPAHGATFTVTKTADTNDGVCGADCSLREAIIAANASPGADTITLPAGTYTLQIQGTGEEAAATGDLDITDDLTIVGASAANTVIRDAAGDRVFHVLGSASADISGLAVRDGGFAGPDTPPGGGIYNSGDLALINVAVTDNFARSGGGGIYNDHSLVLTGTTLSNNGAFSSGAGILNDGSATMTNSTISTNNAAIGGGIHNRGTLTLINSTITSNDAAFSEGGGGIYNFGPATLKNTIVANNSKDDCGGSSPIVSDGHNLDSGDTCGFAGPGDLSNTGPQLGPLADNGGPTQTHAVLPGSPAIDAASPDCPPPDSDQRGIARPLDGDEDGSAICDMGAYEFDPFAPPPPPPTPTPIQPTPGPCDINGPGDVNGDGRVTATDALLVGQVVAGLIGEHDLTCFRNADQNEDRLITVTDALLIAQKVAGII